MLQSSISLGIGMECPEHQHQHYSYLPIKCRPRFSSIKAIGMLKLGAFNICVLATGLLLGEVMPDTSPLNIINLVSNGSTAGLLAIFLFYFYPKSQGEVAKATVDASTRSEAAMRELVDRFTKELQQQRESADKRFDSLMQVAYRATTIPHS